MQATSRIAHVLGPRCPNGTGACQHTLQLSLGPLIQVLDARLRSAASCPTPAPGGTAAATAACGARLQVFSGHDSTLLPLMAGEWVGWGGGRHDSTLQVGRWAGWRGCF